MENILKHLERLKAQDVTGITDNTTHGRKAHKVFVSQMSQKPNLDAGKLDSFMDEGKTYMILQELIDSHVKNELTDRQQRQFKFMVEAFNEEKQR